MNYRMTVTAFALVGATLTSLMGADGGCTDPIIENNGFDLWCGNQLCSWMVESGEVHKVSTWHRSDFAASFDGTLASISQYSDIDSRIQCLRFRAVADVDVTTTVTVEVDFFDDGVIDVAERIPASSWAPVEFHMITPENFRGARFWIRKEGGGRAVLAEMQVTYDGKCVGPRPVISDRELGIFCGKANECSSGFCTDVDNDTYCSECSSTVDCPEPQVCGEDDPDFTVPTYAKCVSPGLDPLGASCRTDAECSSGFCTLIEGNYHCSEYSSTVDCPEPQVCGKDEPDSTVPTYTKCVPPGLDPLGASCRTNAECSSDFCLFGRCKKCPLGVDCG